MDSCELWDPPGNDCCEASVAGGRGWEEEEEEEGGRAGKAEGR